MKPRYTILVAFTRWLTLCSAVLVLAVLTGCATAAQRQATKIHDVGQQATADLIACITDVYHKPVYQPIIPHLITPENGFHPTMSQLTDDTFPTKQESQLLIALHDEILPCKRTGLEKWGSIAPDMAATMADGMVEGDRIMMQLVKRKITWGGYAHQLQQAQEEGRKHILAAAHQIDTNLAASHQAELAQRQAASNALMQWSVQQQLINAASRPTVTTCNDNGLAINCVSNR